MDFSRNKILMLGELLNKKQNLTQMLPLSSPIEREREEVGVSERNREIENEIENEIDKERL